MTEPAMPVSELLRLLFTEGKRRILAVSMVFAVFALGALALGLLLPKEYETHAILLAESKGIIAPLMAGRAVQSGGGEDAQIVRQAFLTRRVLREVLVTGWGEEKDPVEEVRALGRLSSRITILSPRKELIRISYKDTDPLRCYEIANKLTEIYVRESTSGNQRESRDAFDFIDKQVKEYATKVEEAHSKVLSYQRGLTSGAAASARASASAAMGRVLSPEQLAALSVEEAGLAAELSSSESRLAKQRRAERIAQLQRDLDSMLGTLTENHPNVKRAREELRVQQAEAEKANALEDAATGSLRQRLEQVRAKIAAANGANARRLLPGGIPEADPEMRGVGLDSTLSELVRRYEAARQVYQDLLVRRENARVSMELEAEHGGVAVRVYEPAEVPVVATGLRLMHFSLIGIGLGVLAPIGLLFALLQFDPRVRSARQIERFAHVPLLVAIPNTPSVRDRLRDRRDLALAIFIVFAVATTYAVFFVLKVKQP